MAAHHAAEQGEQQEPAEARKHALNKAIDHLGEPGDDKVDVRLGGIYALERIANNSKDDRATIAEILTAYVRGHAAWTSPAEDANRSDAAREELAELRVSAPDIQAVMTVLGRRALAPGRTQQPLLLAGTDLRRADLTYANLKGAILRGAHLEGARGTPGTSWPNGFNWKDAKVHMEE
jgi:Pentapeptide repeats (8 copies)